MVTNIDISPEIARLLQHTCERTRVPFQQQLARNVAEEAVMACPPEAALLLDSEATLSEIAPLARALGFNDIVVNGHHIHVVVLGDDQKIRINPLLVDTGYLSAGVLVVSLNVPVSGKVIGHVTEGHVKEAGSLTLGGEVVLPYHASEQFDLASVLAAVAGDPPSLPAANPTLKAQDFMTFLKDHASFPVETQKQIISAFLTPKVRDNVALVAATIEDSLPNVLKEAAIWNARVEKLSTQLSAKFPTLKAEKVRRSVLKIAEKLGGQVDLPEFQKTLLHELTLEIVSSKLTSQARQQIKGIVDQIYMGSSAIAAVKKLVNNQLTVDIAQKIGEQRRGLIDFADATTEEFGMAFRTLAVQPAYATHSQQESIDLDTVTEALILLETAKLAEELKNLDI